MTLYRPHLLPVVRSKEITNAANGAPCTLRVSSFYPGHRCADPSTVVACHISSVGRGMSTKDTDLGVAFGCAHCHAIVDRIDRQRANYIAEKWPSAFIWRVHEAVMETQAILIDQGVIIVPGAEILSAGSWRA